MTIRPLIQIPAMLLLTANAFGAKPEACVDPKPTWEIRSDYTADGLPYVSRIKDDRTGATSRPYVSGTGGVTSTLFSCSGGSGDAVLLLSPSSTRKVTLDFGPNLNGTPVSPITGSMTLNVRNIASSQWGDRSQEYTFTTWLGSTLPSPKKADWRLRMYSPDSDHQGSVISPADLAATNTPYQTAQVRVQHCPATATPPPGPCAGVIKETWFAYPDPTPNPTFRHVAALVNVASGFVSLGQFEMPFYFVISIQ